MARCAFCQSTFARGAYGAAQEADQDALPPRDPPIDLGQRPQWHRPADERLGAGATYGGAKTTFELIRDEEVLKDGAVLGPFRDDDEWQLAKWLIKHVGHTATDDFLKLSMIRDRASSSFGSKTEFFDKVDDLPGGVKWRCKRLNTRGNVPDLDKDPTGATMRREENELWWRDPVECVKELIGNPAFRDAMRYAPEQLYADAAGTIEVIDEMWTGSWWWEIQVSAHATVLIGYLPIPKFECFDKSTRSLAKYRLFHQCMGVLMESLKEAGTSGHRMVCADSMVRTVFPILAAYVADYPEQCLVACCKENRCPICLVRPDDRGDHQAHPHRDVRETLFFMARQQGGEKDTAFEEHGIRAVYPPFWANLPHSDIFQAFTPDLLHQLHKGVFKDHLVSWCTHIIGTLEVDNRFRDVPDHHGVRHFKNGISSVSQWTGAEHKEMEKVFLGLIAAGAPPQMIFIDKNARKKHFNIPKIHSLEHYEQLIRLFGTADGFNTESPERLHIDYAKNAYRASNRKDYIDQMTMWLQRQEAVARFTAYLDWAHPDPSKLSTTPPAATNTSQIPTITSLDRSSLVISRHFSMAKKPTTRAVEATHIISPTGHGASQFVPALITFLRKANSTFVPHNYDVFGTWKQIRFHLPRIAEIGARHSNDLVRATAPAPASLVGRYKAAVPARLDFALIRTGEQNRFTAHTVLEGLRVAQVKVIFKLPNHYPVKSDTPLAYVEWFTPFKSPNALDGYYHLSRSTRTHRPYAEIISADRIVRSAMLIPESWGI
ncbi:hypothetical protein FB45DRAFT_875154 [Roridomyces roridus]|uniref:Uncharacterized protein n=1 Tax=Roridomyces roridus TaxID=1738132 RepID=A0AAD7B6S5_9AGAR|nr:hypothetical protein FB45DRAFT_875154 [Roridomyces roridus]